MSCAGACSRALASTSALPRSTPAAWTPPPLDAVRAPPLDPLAALRSPWLLGALLVAAALPVARAALPTLWKPWMAAVGLVLPVVLSAWGVTRQHRQALARRHERAVADLHTRLLALAHARLEEIAAEQLATVRQHLTEAEVQRWEQAVQETRREQLRLDGEEHDPRHRTPAFLRVATQERASQAPGVALQTLEDEPSLFSPPSHKVD